MRSTLLWSPGGRLLGPARGICRGAHHHPMAVLWLDPRGRIRVNPLGGLWRGEPNLAGWIALDVLQGMELRVHSQSKLWGTAKVRVRSDAM